MGMGNWVRPNENKRENGKTVETEREKRNGNEKHKRRKVWGVFLKA